MAKDIWSVNPDGSWSTATDWSGGVPGNGDDVVIRKADPHTITYDDASPSASVANLTVTVDDFVVPAVRRSAPPP
jgi:hypothetical protein